MESLWTAGVVAAANSENTSAGAGAGVGAGSGAGAGAGAGVGTGAGAGAWVHSEGLQVARQPDAMPANSSDVMTDTGVTTVADAAKKGVNLL